MAWDDDDPTEGQGRRQHAEYDSRSTVAEVRVQLNEDLLEGGWTVCPVCDKHVQVYRRKIGSRQAYALIRVWREVGSDVGVHVPTLDPFFAGNGGGLSMLRHWGLVARDPDHGDGWWYVTLIGEEFVKGHVSVLKTAITYNARCIGMDGDPWSIKEALGDGFSYDEMMTASSMPVYDAVDEDPLPPDEEGAG